MGTRLIPATSNCQFIIYDDYKYFRTYHLCKTHPALAATPHLHPHPGLSATPLLEKERGRGLTLSHNLVKNSIYVLIF
ncbi:MAG TPA: hypothetical protein PLD12_07910, partial [Bacteroidales bacterium]|nr:hypothetical protein [Bacteroidales bacterium]HPO65891.1 hypothetical protein [Bacteroidales bacterium]